MRTIFLVVAASLILTQFAAAGHCSHWSTSSNGTSTLVVAAPLPGQTYYAILEANAPPLRMYAESNGISGLQRADSTHNDTCHGQINPDTLMF